MASPYDTVADIYDNMFGDDNPYYCQISRVEREVFDAWVPQVEGAGSLALDLGCGTGFHTEWLLARGYDVVGVDTSGEMLRVARHKLRRWGGRVRLEQLSALDYQANPGSWAVIVCLGSTLNHLDDWRRVAGLMGKMLRPGGRFLFSYDNVTGIDVLARLVLGELRGYERPFFRRVVVPRLRAILRAETFRNHWRIAMNGGYSDVRLTYERGDRWVRFLREAGLDVLRLRGVHAVDCWSRKVLQASAGMDPVANRPGRHSGLGLMSLVDRLVSGGGPWTCWKRCGRGGKEY